jgi:hypothetical protein
VDYFCPTCGRPVETTEDVVAYLDAVRKRYEEYGEQYRCLITDNPVGTDTVMRGGQHDCAVCKLVAENLQLRIELDRPEPQPTWAELENLDAEFEQLRKDLNELALYTSAHQACLSGEDNCNDRECREVRALLQGHEEPLDDIRARIEKRRELGAQLVHAWGSEPDPTEDWFERQVAAEQRSSLTRGGGDDEQ